ncbi:MAG: hypothetical protein WC992_00190 [Acholeplasmataceae bacterium]|jgi:hypothetical protein
MDVFERKTTFAGGFNATSTKVVFAGFRSGLSFDTVGFNYNQQVVRLWDLDGDGGSTYLVAGPASGSLQIAKTIGPRSLSLEFYQRYSSVCRASENILALQASVGCITKTGESGTRSGSLNIALNGVVFAGINLNVASSDPIIRQGLAGTFISLEWDEQGASQN